MIVLHKSFIFKKIDFWVHSTILQAFAILFDEVMSEQVGSTRLFELLSGGTTIIRVIHSLNSSGVDQQVRSAFATASLTFSINPNFVPALTFPAAISSFFSSS